MWHFFLFCYKYLFSFSVAFVQEVPLLAVLFTASDASMCWAFCNIACSSNSTLIRVDLIFLFGKEKQGSESHVNLSGLSVQLFIKALGTLGRCVLKGYSGILHIGYNL